MKSEDKNSQTDPSQDDKIKKIFKEFLTDKTILDAVMKSKPEIFHQMISQFMK